MRIYPEVSDKIGEIESPPATETQTSIGSKPILSRKAMITQAVVKSGDTIVIGGLIRDSQEKKVSKIPILGDIPILGLPFKRVSKSNVKKDLIIFLTPSILENSYEKLSLSTPRPEEKVVPSQTEIEVKSEGPLPVGEEPASPPLPSVGHEQTGIEAEEPKPEIPKEIATEEIPPVRNTISNGVKVEPKEVENKEEIKKEEDKEEVKEETKEGIKEQIEAFNKDKAKESFEKGLEYLAEDKYEEAKVELETSLRLNPDDVAVRQFLNSVKDWVSVLEK